MRIFKRAINGEFTAGFYEDFQLPSLGELAEQIEKYVQAAIGANLQENDRVIPQMLSPDVAFP